MIQKTEFGYTGSITDLPVWGTNPEMGFVAALVAITQMKTNSWCKGMELPDGSFSGCSCDCPACEARAKLVPRLKQSLDFIYKVVTKERERLGPANLDGHLNAIGGTVLEMQKWIKEAHPPRALTPQEKAKGRSEGYWEMSAEDQWAEDKRLGILDWDGK